MPPAHIVIATESVINTRCDGYIYVLPRDEFKNVMGYKNEFYSTAPVMSKFIIPVKASDFSRDIIRATLDDFDKIDELKAKKCV